MDYDLGEGILKSKQCHWAVYLVGSSEFLAYTSGVLVFFCLPPPAFCCNFLQIGDLQRSYTAAQKSEAAYPGHVDTQHLIKQLKQHFAMLWLFHRPNRFLWKSIAQKQESIMCFYICEAGLGLKWMKVTWKRVETKKNRVETV